MVNTAESVWRVGGMWCKLENTTEHTVGRLVDRLLGKAHLKTRGTGMVKTARGVIYIHSAAAALCPHIEWAIGGALGRAVHCEWTRQGAQPGALRTEIGWDGPRDTAAALVSALIRCRELRFEVTCDADNGTGERYSYTPALGVFRASTDEAGDIQVGENQLRAAVAREALGGRSIHEAISELLGTPWDDELEIFRHAGEDSSVRWLTRAV